MGNEIIGRLVMDDNGVPKIFDDDRVLADMMAEVYAWAIRKGWRGQGSPSRTFGDEVALLHSEISEALEAFRITGTERAVGPNEGPWKNIYMNPYPEGEKPQGVPSEFADVLIRLLDNCAHHGIDLFAEFRAKMDYNETREHRHGGKRL